MEGSLKSRMMLKLKRRSYRFVIRIIGGGSARTETYGKTKQCDEYDDFHMN